VRQHQSYLPLGLASLGASVVSYALLVNYNMLVEISGFALLAAGVAFDWHWRRRRQREVLGIDSAANLSRVDPD
jgi:arsenite methyltransferase